MEQLIVKKVDGHEFYGYSEEYVNEIIKNYFINKARLEETKKHWNVPNEQVYAVSSTSTRFNERSQES